MSYSSSRSTSGGFSTSIPSNMQSPQSYAALNFANIAAGLGQQTYNWATQAVNTDNAMTDESVQDYLQMSQEGLGLANENLTDYNNIYRPEMAQLADEAGSYSSAARQEVNEGAAEAQSEAGSNAGLSQAAQQLQSYGINPNSGMYQELQESQRAAAGAAAAGAGQEAGLATQATGRQLLGESLQQGDQLPAAAVNALNSAYQGVAGAENATLANTQVAGQALDAANPYFQSAMQLKYPPVGNTSQSVQSSQSSSTPKQSSGGYSGGGGGGSSGGGGGSGRGAVSPNTYSAYGQPGSSSGYAGGMSPTSYSGGGGGAYRHGGLVHSRHGAIPTQPGDTISIVIPSRQPALAHGGIPIPATRQGGFHSNAPSLRSMASGGPTTGGFVSKHDSPSNGRQTDDIPARLNAEEFVMPRDTTKYYGHKFFLDLIKKARLATGGNPHAPVGAQQKPAAGIDMNHPRFVSHPMGR